MQNTTRNVDIYLSRSRHDSVHDLPAPQHDTSPTSTCSEVTIQPYHGEPPAYTTAPYLDSPPLPYYDSPTTSAHTPCRSIQQHPLTFNNPTPTNILPPTTSSRPSYSSDSDDEDVPLAHLLLYRRDAPPAYSTVVRHSYRETLLQHIPRHPVIMGADEEAALESMQADDVSFTVERLVAMAVVMAVLVIAGVWMIHVITQSHGTW